jgi:hypothetical protein
MRQLDMRKLHRADRAMSLDGKDLVFTVTCV